MGFLAMVGAQYRRPSGLAGRILGHVMNWQHGPLAGWAIELLDVRPSDRVLDIGCGGGEAVRRIARITVDGFVHGVDHSRIMVQQTLKHNAAAVRAGRVAIENASVSNLPCDDESVDRACAIESFYFWPDPIAGLKEVHRVLRHGGRAMIALELSKEMPNLRRYSAMAAKMQCPIYSGAEMVDMLTEAGFSQAQFQVRTARKAIGSGHWFCATAVK